MNNPIPTLSDGQSDALRKNLMALLAAQAGRYTQGASGSLPKETMDELLVSALYTLSVDPTRPESFAPLVGQDIFACFFQAQTRLLQKRDAALALASSLCLRMDDLGCVALRTTLSSLLNGLKRYDAVFFAHHVPGDIDYQLCMPVSESLMGVDYALRYLQRLELEDELLTCFPIHRVAGTAGRRKRPLARAGLQPADPGAGKRHGVHAARQTAAQAACLRRRPCGAAGHALRQDRRRACAPV